MEAIGIGVAIAVISAAILAAARWLSSRENREEASSALRQRACEHQWEPINKPGEQVVIISVDSEWCVKCDARR